MTENYMDLLKLSLNLCENKLQKKKRLKKVLAKKSS